MRGPRAWLRTLRGGRRDETIRKASLGLSEGARPAWRLSWWVADRDFCHVDEGELVPWWAAVAYRDHLRGGAVIAPIGLAQLLGLARRWYFAVKRPISESRRLALEQEIGSLRTALRQTENVLATQRSRTRCAEQALKVVSDRLDAACDVAEDYGAPGMGELRITQRTFARPIAQALEVLGEQRPEEAEPRLELQWISVDAPGPVGTIQAAEGDETSD